MSDTVSEIIMWHRQRCFFMEQRKRGHLALASFLRTALGWRLDLPEKERKAIAKRAMDLIKTGRSHLGALEKQKPFECDEPDYQQWSGFILSALQGDEFAAVSEKNAEKHMVRLAKTLPVWEWAQEVHGFGPLGLAIIVGEAGDLSAYPTHSHLWKRMGVAVLDGVRQGGLRKGADAEDWIAHGYNRQRRSRLYTIGDSLIKKQNPYRELYLERKAFEAERMPEASKMHCHRRAQRYTEKRLLKHLWQAWRRAAGFVPGRAVTFLPAANEHRAGA